MRSGVHVVVGTGPVGAAVARELRGRGARVRAVNRRGRSDGLELPDGVEVVAADVADPADAERALSDAAVTYLCAKPADDRWTERFPPLVDGAVAGAAAADAVLVFADDLWAYGPVDGPLTEDRPDDATDPLGRARADATRRLLDAHDAGRVRAAVGRASDLYGPGVLESVVGSRVFANALRDRVALVLGDPDQPHTYTFVDDFARALITLGDDPAAWGRAWHVPSAPTLTTREFVTAVYEAAEATPRMRALPGWAMRALAPVSSRMRRLSGVRYAYTRPFVVDHGAFESAFGADPTPHEEAVRRTLDWYAAEVTFDDDRRNGPLATGTPTGV